MDKKTDVNNCYNTREMCEWLYNRLMALENALYTADNFNKFQRGENGRPKGWERKRRVTKNE